MNEVWIIVVMAIVGLIILAANQSSVNAKKKTENITSSGYQKDDLISAGKYISGHPDLDNEIQTVQIGCKDGKLYMLTFPDTFTPKEHANIPCQQIKNVLIEDATTIEKRVTVGRLLTVGVFALAWKKKKKQELSFLIIEWNDGRFDHETIFEYTGINTVQRSNEARNKLMRLLR